MGEHVTHVRVAEALVAGRGLEVLAEGITPDEITTAMRERGFVAVRSAGDGLLVVIVTARANKLHTVAYVTKMILAAAEPGFREVIAVVGELVAPKIARALAEQYAGFVRVRTHVEMQMNPVANEAYSPHTRIPPDEVAATLGPHTSARGLARMLESDPVCVWLGFTAGDLLQEGRPGGRVSYRYVYGDGG